MPSARREPEEHGGRRGTLRAVVCVSFSALLFAQAAGGLDPGTALTQYGHTAWRVRDGHFAGEPTAITQTRDGFLWIGTQAGLFRFDGVRFMPWEPPAGSQLPNDSIVSLLGTRDGSLWIGTAIGLAQWRAPNLVIHTRLGRFGDLLEDRRGTIWAGHTRAISDLPPLCRFMRGDFRCFGFPDEHGLSYVRALHEDRQGNVWLGGDYGACRFKPETPENPKCFAIGSPAQGTDDHRVVTLADDSGGTLWAGTLAQGIWRLVAGRWTRYSSPWGPELEANLMRSDRAGGLWIGTLSHGLLRLVQGRTERFTRADGLSGDAVSDLLKDREGSLWVATTAGLDRFRDVKVATLTAQEGLGGGDVGAVLASRDGSLWIAERRALIRLEPTGMSFYRAGQSLPGSSPTSLFEDSRGRLWVGVDTGLAWWEHGRFFQLTMPDGSAVGMVRAMAEDRDGDLWVATVDPSRTLVRVRDGRVFEAFSSERIGENQIYAMAADPRGGLWLGLTGAELKRYRNGRFEAHGRVGDPSRRRIRNLLFDVRGLWVVTNRGLGLLRHGKLRTLDTQNGLPCGNIQDAVWGGDGSLWLKATCGLVRIPAGELGAWTRQPGRRVRVRVLDALDGAQTGLSPFMPRSARSPDGRLWFAIEGGGLQVVDPGKIAGNRIPPPVQILRVVADRKSHEPKAGLRLPPLTRDLEIDYTALSLSMPEKVGFRYRLEGAQGDWQDAGTRREAFFTNLKPGDYRFRVIAANNDGVWNPKGATLDFAILPAFYQTRGFFLLCFAASAFLLWAAYRWRVRQIAARLDLQFEERLAERTRIAQDLHDTLLQGVLSASMQLHVAVDGIPADAPEKPLLSRALQLLAQVIEEGRNAVRGLRTPAPQPSGADDLGQALSRVPQEFGLKEPGNFRVLVEGPERPLHPLIRDEVYRIGREALVNAFRHSGAAGIEVEIEFAARALRVLVRDDGKGIDPEVLRAGREGHWGLSGMRERAERMGARLKVWSRAGAGTEIELSVPGEVAFQGKPAGWLGWVHRRLRGASEIE
ncbi:MAG TPA: two-component regulator propeller domain-containing protein [Thermoanaerobaculia bacterium]|nr:two-component regulator propeller domain-containing protein [Thermoanaerobaculia bacterium]